MRTMPWTPRWTAAVLLLAGAAAWSDGPASPASPTRVTLRGETAADLECAISWDGVDWAESASVARAKAGIDGALDARLDLQCALVLTRELAQAYRGLVNSVALARLEEGEELADLRRRAARLAGARLIAVAGKAQDGGGGRVFHPVLVTLHADGRELHRGAYRVLLQPAPSGGWQVVRIETRCPECGGAALPAGDGTCRSCAGRGWTERPEPRLAGRDSGLRPRVEVDRTTPQGVAVGFLRWRHALDSDPPVPDRRHRDEGPTASSESWQSRRARTHAVRSTWFPTPSSLSISASRSPCASRSVPSNSTCAATTFSAVFNETSSTARDTDPVASTSDMRPPAGTALLYTRPRRSDQERTGRKPRSPAPRRAPDRRLRLPFTPFRFR